MVHVFVIASVWLVMLCKAIIAGKVIEMITSKLTSMTVWTWVVVPGWNSSRDSCLEFIVLK
jgi:hypothetical protein